MGYHMLNLLRDFLERPRTTRPRSGLLLRKMIDSGGLVTFEEFVDLLWGRREDGGPLNPRDVLSVEMYHLRKELKPGVRIRNAHGHGYALEVSKEFAEKAILEIVAKKLGLDRG